MPFFKVGDVVTVRDDLDMDKKYRSQGEDEAHCRIVYEMYECRGKRMQITSIHNTHDSYRYVLSGCDWRWTDEMFDEYLDHRYDSFDDEIDPSAPSKAEIFALLGI